jgi:hypothetical protein
MKNNLIHMTSLLIFHHISFGGQLHIGPFVVVQVTENVTIHSKQKTNREWYRYG